MGKTKASRRREEFLHVESEKNTMEEVARILEDFSDAYCLQKGVDLEDIELVVYDQGKKQIMYFRRKFERVNRYGSRKAHS